MFINVCLESVNSHIQPSVRVQDGNHHEGGVEAVPVRLGPVLQARPERALILPSRIDAHEELGEEDDREEVVNKVPGLGRGSFGPSRLKREGAGESFSREPANPTLCPADFCGAFQIYS